MLLAQFCQRLAYSFGDKVRQRPKEVWVAIQIKANRRHKKEPPAQYAQHWVGVWKFVASTWASKLGGSVGGWADCQVRDSSLMS
jgi:hypothetical protein